MKKRIFSLMAVVMFISSSMNAINKNVEANNDCAAEAYKFQGDLEGDGMPKYLANEWANEFYEFCVDYMG